MSATELDRALHASVLKREAAKEAEFREARAKHEEEVRLGFGATDMSKQELKKIIDSDRRMYYRSEDLNDKLFIHYKGWKEMKNLEGWTGLKALYAECNAFDRTSGLSQCRNLRSLFLQENCIRRIEGLEGCPLLWNLNLSSNFIERIEGLSQLRSLNTLTIQKNKIGFAGVEDVVHLVDTTISTLDLQDNKIWDPDILPEVFTRMADLRVLYLKGNPCAKKIPNYRKGITAVCQNLKYLDDRPVFPEDRRAADAFNRGGLEEERAERRRIKEEENSKHERNMKAFQEMIENVRREKRERDAMRVEDKFTDATDPVVTTEQRMQRQVDRWKEENAEDLKDDAREHAEHCLQSEREVRSADSDGESNASGENNSKEERQEEPQQAGNVEDKRKLVYEDIWEEPPELAGKKAARPAFQPPPRHAVPLSTSPEKVPATPAACTELHDLD